MNETNLPFSEISIFKFLLQNMLPIVQNVL